MPLAAHLGALAGAPVVVDNNVNLAVVGAAVALDCRADLAYLSVGTGLAAGLLLDGRIRAAPRRGRRDRPPADRPPRPAVRVRPAGCLEAVASGTAIAARWPAPDGALTAASTLLAAVEEGDPEAAAVLAEVAGHLAGAVALLAQPSIPRSSCWGAAWRRRARLLAVVQGVLRQRASRSPVLAAIHLADRVALVPEGVPAGALGAAVVAHRSLGRSAAHEPHSAAGQPHTVSDTVASDTL